MNYLFVILISFSLLPGVHATCESVSRKLSKLLQEGSKDELLLSMNDDVEEAKEIAKELRLIEGEIDDLEEAGNLKKAEALKPKAEKIRNKILAINDSYMKKTSRLFEQEGIPHSLVENEGKLIMHLNLDEVPQKNRSMRFYQRVKKKFGVKKVTISFGDNAAYGRKGFFRRGESRVEIGHGEILNLIDGDVGVTPRHEFRHANFANKEVTGVPSAYQVRFRSGKATRKYLNDRKSYHKYMSAEEVYNWSTDLQTLAKKLRDATPETEPEIIKAITAKTKGAYAVMETASDVPGKVRKRLEETIKDGQYWRFEIPEDNVFKFQDTFGRTAEVTFVDPAQVKLLEEARKVQNDIYKSVDSYILPQLKERGLTDPSSKDYKIARRNLRKEFLKTPEGLKLESKLNVFEKEMALAAIERLKSLKRVADKQLEEYDVLSGLLEKLKTVKASKRPDLIGEIRSKMKEIGNNVKEGYKGSLLKEN